METNTPRSMDVAGGYSLYDEIMAITLERKKKVKLINFIVWLSTGAVIGWFASRLASAEHKWTHKPANSKTHGLKKS
jgi:hypothetical protein